MRYARGMDFPKSYTPRDSDRLFVATLLHRAGSGIAAGIITGAPGVGKTSLGAAMAEGIGGMHLVYQAHHWTADEDLFVKIDPARVAALAGGLHSIQIADAYRDGALLRAVRESERQPTVLVLDEWDKAPERADALLLEFLQSGTVRGPFGEMWTAKREKLFVIVTSNDLRPLSEPLLRRCYRYRMTFLAPEIERDIMRKATGAKVGVIKAISAAMLVIRKHGETSPSLSEGIALISALTMASTVSDVQQLATGYLTKTSRDEAAMKDHLPRFAVALWGEMRR